MRIKNGQSVSYQSALAALPETDEQDNRKQRSQLVKSQLAWKEFTDANCALVGGLEGGDNIWVTEYATRCTAEATTERIEFLKSIANP